MGMIDNLKSQLNSETDANTKEKIRETYAQNTPKKAMGKLVIHLSLNPKHRRMLEELSDAYGYGLTSTLRLLIVQAYDNRRGKKDNEGL